MRRASDIVEDRLDRAASALSAAGVPYAVIGGLAVAAWVATADEAAVRLTRDVNMLLNRADLPRAREALEAEGFTHRRVAGIELFLDSPDSKAADAVHVIFAEESVRPGDDYTSPAISETVSLGGVAYIPLMHLVSTKLSVNRDKDRVHVRDMIGVGLVDASWLPRLPATLAARLKALLNDPEG